METKARINRIIGQLKGVAAMIEKERDCADVLQQLGAIKKAIDGLSRVLVLAELEKDQTIKTTPSVKKIIANIINL